MRKRNNVEKTQHSQKKTGIEREVEEFSVLQCHTPISPRDCPQESLLSHQNGFCHCCKACGEGEGWEQLNPNTLRSSPFSRNTANGFPFQNIVLLESKLEASHAPSRKGNVEK